MLKRTVQGLGIIIIIRTNIYTDHVAWLLLAMGVRCKLDTILKGGFKNGALYALPCYSQLFRPTVTGMIENLGYMDTSKSTLFLPFVLQ